ncbi:geranylgeranylglycerol-phosphate geranylgeranyltransferase [Thermoflexibacter ruber]|uniref:4-hydroxybenzoate polyprenyltransferase n=1 Tax=Thermoflexibacter ruber TaxID=1003 RepID=A0A1I2GWJ1_9BACT|nr:geranylgeranylglycerol-phosphate geranylgeranyltransferase [Thermoflexibacter ruber]SFF21449.1 4-hydroxybenzoate polyprenyltransferase [Thermoflexibacter ruber]
MTKKSRKNTVSSDKRLLPLKRSSRLFYFFRLIRLPNLLIIAFTLLFTHYFLVPADFHTVYKFSQLFLLIISTTLIAAGGYVINDYFDVKIDLVNKPDKVLINKVFTKKSIWQIYVLLNFLALLAGFLADMKIALIQIFCGLSLYFYALYLKKIALLGNGLVALLSALVVLLANVLYEKNFPLVYLFAGFAFFISLIRELVKDIEDIEGDKAGNCQTFPILFGVFNTKLLIFSVILLFFLSLFYFPHWLFLSIPYYLLYCFFISILLLTLAWQVFFAKSKADFHRVSNFSKLIMLLGMVGMIFLQIQF